MSRSIDFSRATASAICNSSSLLALTAAIVSLLRVGLRAGCAPAQPFGVCAGAAILAASVRHARYSVRSPCLLRRNASSDQFVGQHQPGFHHVVDPQQDFGGAGRGIAAAQPHALAFDAAKRAAEPPASVDRSRHFDLRDMAGIAVEIRAPHQRPVDARARKSPAGRRVRSDRRHQAPARARARRLRSPRSPSCRPAAPP